MKLEYPYSEDWERGYVVVNGEGRKTVILYNNHADRSSTSLARYLVSVSLGRYLESDEHVDHIDNDKTNDVLENLQILTLRENNNKEAKRRGRLVAEIQCPVCGTVFVRRKGNTQAVPSLRGKVMCCSKDCSNDFKKKNLSKDEKLSISRRTLKRVFRLHE